MAFSVNTNYGASVAVQQLNKTNKELETVQQRLNTGLRVASAKDDGAIYAIAQGRRAELSGYGVVQQSLAKGISTLDVALAAGDAISDLLLDMREHALAATDTTLTSDQRSSYNTTFKALRAQITKIISSAEFNGANLVNGSGNYSALVSHDGTSQITINDENLSIGGTTITLTLSTDLDSQSEAVTTLAKLDASIDNVSSAVARLGAGAKSLEVHHNFVGKLADTLEAGIGNLVDADIARESARLQALQVRQQLGVEALSIANNYATQLLGLFR